jgi:peptidoglycan/LPS O-acetylase OafA/YrhL
MTAHFSVYLDLLRITAAMFVVVAHLQSWGLALWLPNLSGRDAVVVFFVLSGLVITHAAKDRTFRQYAVARFARIYSVALPIIILSIIVDQFGMRYDSSIYPLYQYEKLWLYVPFHLAFLGDFWTLSEQPFSVPVWWSLNFEVWFYVLFAVVTFWSGWRRIALCILVLSVMGYKLWLLLPIWVAGSWLYGRIDRFVISPHAARCLVVGTVAIYLLLEIAGVDESLWHVTDLIVGGSAEHSPLGSARKFLSDWLVGGLVVLHLFGWRHANWAISQPFAAAVRWAAGFTFTLYLLHSVVLKFIIATGIVDPNSVAQGLAVLVIVLVATLAVGLITEHRRGAWALGFDNLWTLGSKAAWRIPRLASLLAPSR